MLAVPMTHMVTSQLMDMAIVFLNMVQVLNRVKRLILSLSAVKVPLGLLEN